MKRTYLYLMASTMVLGLLVLTGCLFSPPGETATSETLTFVADALSGPPSLDDGGFKVTFNCAGGNGSYVIAFGDGATGVPASSISHTYTQVGSYTATCTSGTDTASLVVTVLNSPCGVLYEPFIKGNATWPQDCTPTRGDDGDCDDCDDDSDDDPPSHPCIAGNGCDDQYEECDLWLCKNAILDGRYYTTGTGANKEQYGLEPCCGYEIIYSWQVTMTSVCAALDLPLYVYGEGPTVMWRIGKENPSLHPDYPVLTSDGSYGPLAVQTGNPYGPKVALAEITLTVTDQFGSWQSITIERWVCTCEGCGASPCTDYPEADE